MFPKQVNRYEIIELIGGNERGAVYKARDIEAGREVAVKLLEAQSLFTLTTQRKFAQQMNALKALNHPGLLPLIDFGSEDNRPYIVMPLMTGNLSARMGSQPVAVDEALQLAGQVADALDYAAVNGAFHYDLKPNNVLLDSQGRPFIADLGLVQVINSLSAANKQQVNPYYMSPEQVRRRPLSPASHVYSLAAILYHMLTGQTLFTGASELVASFKHTSEKPRGIRSLRKELTQTFETVMARALEKRAEDRYPTCRTFIQQLIAAQGGSISPEEVRSMNFERQTQRAPVMPQRRAPQPGPQTLTPQQAEQVRKNIARAMTMLAFGIVACVAFAVALAMLLGQ